MTLYVRLDALTDDGCAGHWENLTGMNGTLPAVPADEPLAFISSVKLSRARVLLNIASEDAERDRARARNDAWLRRIANETSARIFAMQDAADVCGCRKALGCAGFAQHVR